MTREGESVLYYLAGDVGGTNSRLEYYSITRTPSGEFSEKLLERKTYPSQEYPSLTLIVKQFFLDVGVTDETRPKTACVAAAGPIKDGKVYITNVGWVIDIEEMRKSLGIEVLKMINDLEGCGYGLLVLQDDDLVCINNVPAAPAGVKAVIGAGTGLGEAYLTQQGGEYIVWPSEGGHTDYGPRTPLECELMFDIKDHKSISRVSVERVVSGMGILSIYQFLARKYPELVEKEVQKELENCKPNQEGEIITRHAKKSEPNTICKQALDMFVSNYGSEAGNMSIKTLCFGGMYIAGGIAPHVIDLIREGTFMNSFANKGRMKEMLLQIPVNVVMHKSVNMLGARVYCRRLLRKQGFETGDDREMIAMTEAAEKYPQRRRYSGIASH